MSITYKRTHIGKIGRLDSYIRHELNVRLENGEPHKSLVAWLNNLPEVQKRLKLWFDDRPITEQNVSDWKQSGHLAWLRLQETRELANQLTEAAEDLELNTKEDCLSDRLALQVAVELSRMMTTLLEEEGLDTETKWKRLKEVHRELSQLRRDDHRAAKLRMERKEQEVEETARANARIKALEELHKKQLIDQLMAPIENKNMGEMFSAMGYGDKGEKVAELAYRIRTDRPYKELADEIFGQGRNPSKGQQNGENPGKSN